MSPLPPLPKDEVHVWTVRLDRPVSLARLSGAERERCLALRHPESRRRFAGARAALRLLLGHYLDCDGGALPVEFGPYGKPCLAGGSRLRFNLSHSREVALLAFAWDREVGVDVEAERDLDPLRIAGRVFSPGEVAELRRLAPPERREAFFRAWTRKEAFIKARGEGLAHSLQSFTVSLAPDPAPSLLHHEDPAEVARWRFAAATAPPGYAAALAAEAGPWVLRQEALSPPLDD